MSKFTPTVKDVQNLVNHSLMNQILRRAIRQFGNTNAIPATDQTIMVYNKVTAVTKKA